MKLLLDTNIIIDIISKRQGYEHSLQVMRYCEIKRAAGFVSALTVTDAMYILRKHIVPEGVRIAVQTLLSVVDTADVLKSDILTAFFSEVRDYEDAVQASCARRIKADYIVTHNIKDFVQSVVTAITPIQALKLIEACP